MSNYSSAFIFIIDSSLIFCEITQKENIFELFEMNVSAMQPIIRRLNIFSVRLEFPEF